MQRIYADSFGESINGMDAPEHPRYRRLFQKAFMPQTVSNWGNCSCRSIVDRIIDRFRRPWPRRARQRVHVELPFEVIYAQLALPAEATWTCFTDSPSG